MKRAWTYRPLDERCEMNVILIDGSGAQCRRPKLDGSRYCKQHRIHEWSPGYNQPRRHKREWWNMILGKGRGSF